MTSPQIGNFVIGECFCDIECLYGHRIRLFNIGRGHYIACDKCRTFMYVGSNLMSSWREENEDIWQANYNSVKGYRFLG